MAFKLNTSETILADYIITPDKKEIPSSYFLSEELHRRALAVEMEVHGTNYKWQRICFYEPAAPKIQCFAEFDALSVTYRIFLAPESNQESEEMRHALVEIILHETGGKVYDAEAGESYDFKAFINRGAKSGSEVNSENPSASYSDKPARSLPPTREILWIAFSWFLVLLGFCFFRLAAPPHKMFVLGACILALISAGGITFSKSKTK
jgi:hypothetical protein